MKEQSAVGLFIVKADLAEYRRERRIAKELLLLITPTSFSIINDDCLLLLLFL